MCLHAHRDTLFRENICCSLENLYSHLNILASQDIMYPQNFHIFKILIHIHSINYNFDLLFKGTGMYLYFAAIIVFSVVCGGSVAYAQIC